MTGDGGVGGVRQAELGKGAARTGRGAGARVNEREVSVNEGLRHVVARELGAKAPAEELRAARRNRNR